MTLKYKLDSIDDLDEPTQALYEQKGDVYVLKVEGISNEDDVVGLKNQVQTLLTEKKTEKDRADKAERDLAKAKQQKAAEEGDIDALNASWQEKLDAALAEKDGEIESRDRIIRSTTSKAKAIELATTLAVPGSADVLLPHIEGRVRTEIKDGEATIVVLGHDGKPSALTLEELGKEIANDKRFAPIIDGSKATGGGANGSGGGAAPKAKAAADMNTTEKSAFISEHGLPAWEKKVRAEGSAKQPKSE